MANFCVACGGSLNPGAGFCQHCGTRVTQVSAGAPAQPPPAQSFSAPPTAQAPPSSGSGLKILLICFLLFCALGLAGMVGMFYYAKHRIHEKLADLKERTGIDLPAAIDDAAHTQVRPLSHGDACAVLTRDEAQRVLGMAIVRTVRNDSGSEEQCSYFTDAASRGAAADQTSADIDELSKRKTSNSGDASEIEDVMKNIAAGVADGRVPLLQVTVFRGNAKIATTAFNLGNGLMGAGKAHPVDGPWDEAVFGPLNSTLTIRKGDNGAMIDLRQVAHGRDRGLELARIIANRL